METVIAACGLVCSRCDAYRATKEGSLEKLELVAADWRRRYACDQIAASNIRCNGCMTDGGPKCGHCESACEVRKCAMGKGVSTCAQCASFPCERLSGLYGFMGEQGRRLMELLEALRAAEKAMHSAF